MTYPNCYCCHRYYCCRLKDLPMTLRYQMLRARGWNCRRCCFSQPRRQGEGAAEEATLSHRDRTSHRRLCHRRTDHFDHRPPPVAAFRAHVAWPGWGACCVSATADIMVLIFLKYTIVLGQLSDGLQTTDLSDRMRGNYVL